MGVGMKKRDIKSLVLMVIIWLPILLLFSELQKVDETYKGYMTDKNEQELVIIRIQGNKNATSFEDNSVTIESNNEIIQGVLSLHNRKSGT